MRFRQSELKTWQSCALQAKFRYLEGRPGYNGSKSTFGTCIHHALEQYSRSGDVDQALKAFLEVWDDPALLGVEIDRWDRFTTSGGLRQKGMEIIRAYDHKQAITPKKVVFVEHPFLVPFGRHELMGTVDLGAIRQNHHGHELLCIEDWKTASTKPNRAELGLNTQFTCYIYASLQPEFWLGNPSEPGFPPVPNGEWWFEMLAATVRRGIWIHLYNNCEDLDVGDRNEADFARLYRLCNEIEKAIEHDVFVPTISGDSCVFCSYANGPCPTRVPTRDEWDQRFEQDHNSWL